MSPHIDPVTAVLIQHHNLIIGLHILAVIAWMAGLLYLPRLFVYHTRAAAGSEMDETFKTMEAKLLRIIMNPAMIVVWILGLNLIWVDRRRLGLSPFLGRPGCWRSSPESFS